MNVNEQYLSDVMEFKINWLAKHVQPMLQRFYNRYGIRIICGMGVVTFVHDDLDDCQAIIKNWDSLMIDMIDSPDDYDYTVHDMQLKYKMYLDASNIMDIVELDDIQNYLSDVDKIN
tara:strand:- start:124 stop:474 length:351 start_codon:yes stop_codon:yes gene_type:complete